MMSSIVDLKIKTPMTSKELIAFRTTFGLSQKTLAQLLGITCQAVDLWENDQRRVPETTHKILKLFKKYPTLINEF